MKVHWQQLDVTDSEAQDTAFAQHVARWGTVGEGEAGRGQHIIRSAVRGGRERVSKGRDGPAAAECHWQRGTGRRICTACC